MMLSIAALTLAQLQVAAPSVPIPPAPRSAVAIRTMQAPVIDGKMDDPVWQTAVPITGFREWQPNEDRDPKLPTEARILYDAANLYVFIRAFDPHPDSIIRYLSRRDNWTPADMMGIIIDSYHDRRTGYEFFVNASGVKVDQAMYNDGNEDNAWDAVWDVSTRIDSAGWTAEFRIPLSQLRFGTGRDHTFGIVVMRDIYRYNERTSWPVLRQSQAGAVNQFGDLTGLADLEAPRRLEALPYIVTKSATQPAIAGYGTNNTATIGADVKYRVASNLTLDATFNPDFGQVESDPSVYNLTTVESFFNERRPFFVAGSGLFQFNVDCTAVNDCGTGEGLFYSRRIGRTPELAGTYGDGNPQPPTRIIGAAKLTGRLAGGLQIGLMDAVTERTTSGVTADTTLAPATNYAVVRLVQDLRGGESELGGMFTALNRSQDAFTSPYLHSGAYAGALDFRHRFQHKQYQVSASAAFSRLDGSAASIAQTQLNPVHYYQRADGANAFDSTLTTLSGTSLEGRFGKVGGKHFLFQTDVQRRSAGFDVNDLGYLQRADQTNWSTWAGYFDRATRRYYKRFQWNNNWWQYWSADGLPLERAYNTNTHINFKNNWSFHLGSTFGQLGTTYDDRAARGGPALRQNPYVSPWMGINGDDRKWIVPFVWFNWYRAHEGRAHSVSISPELDFKLGTPMTASLSVNWSHSVNDAQWYGNFTDSVTHYTFANLDQHTLSLTTRLNYTMTPNMTLQVYLAPFVTRGTYSNVKQLSATPRADAYDARFAAFGDTSVTNNPGGFNFKQVASNVVFRWEYRPGSALFLVWSQGRSGFIGQQGTQNWRDDYRDLFGIHPANTFLVKLAYWFNR